MSQIEIFKKIDVLVSKYVMHHDMVHLGYLAEYAPSEKEINAVKEGKPIKVPEEAKVNPPQHSNPNKSAPTIHDLIKGHVGATPQYSLDILSSWRIVSKLTKEENISFELKYNEDKWTAKFKNSEIISKLAPLSISLAALKYKEINIEKEEIPSDLFIEGGKSIDK